MSRNILFISVDTIKERTGLHFNTDEKLVNPEILTAQDMYILPALGTALYERLQDAIANSNLNASETTLLDTYITPTLVYYVMSELPMGLSYQFYNKGIIRKSGEGQENPSAAELIDVADRYKTRAEFYKQRLVKYLIDRSGFNTFPQYNNPGSTYDTIVPERQAYTSSVWLGSEDGKMNFEDKYQGNINRCCGE
ncbi:MAG: hypothetical protein FJY17_00975 [Bacteroidetes bacterium]|nr:hypothetical protein [Bacteroidota bacterium]